MKRRYVVKREGSFDGKEGDTIDLELDAEGEQYFLNTGQLELAERKYKVAGATEVYGARNGETFTAALPADQEAALLSAGQVRLVEDEPTTKAKGGKS